MQNTRDPDLESDLKASPRASIVLLAVAAALLTLGAFSLARPTIALVMAVCLYGAAAGLWLFSDHHPREGRIVTVAVYLVVIAIGASVLGIPELALLGCGVTAMAAALSGATLALCAGGAEALVLIALGLTGVLSWTLALVGIALDGAVLASALVMLGPMRTLVYWAYERYDHARALLDEARQRQAELKQALNDLAHANRELALAHDRIAALRLVAEDSRRTKAQFVSNVSHEFRAPLNIIIGLAEILLDAQQVYGQELPAEARKDVAILYRNSQHLVGLVNDVLDLSQIEAGQLSMRREWVDLGGILRSAAEMVRPLAAAKDLTLTVHTADDLVPVFCDPRRIRQVVLNLVSNAARFTEQGGIVITARREGDAVVVSVQDTGPGISLEDIERIFEPFEQSASTGAVLGRGSGLGLTISREFVQLHDGSIWVNSVPGQGSTFSFRLPIGPVAGPVAPAERWLAPAWSVRERSSRTPVGDLGDRVVLYDRAGRLGAALDRYAGDIELLSAADADEVRRLCTQESARSVLLCSGDSVGLLREVQSLADDLPGTPVLGITMTADAAGDGRGGALAYVIKPVTVEGLRSAFQAVGVEGAVVLVVDDDPDARHVLAAQLRRLHDGIQVLEAASGAEALAIAAERRPDLMLLDVIMPGMDGWQTLAAVRARDDLASLPVVMVSAQDLHAEPLTGSLMMASIQGGLSLGKMIDAFRAITDVLLPHAQKPAAEPRGSHPE